MRADIRPSSVAAAAASVLGGDAWLIGLAWGGDDGAAMLALGACLVLTGVLLLAACWPVRTEGAHPAPTVGRTTNPTAGTGAPVLGQG